jgi:hypothetical protein
MAVRRERRFGVLKREIRYCDRCKQDFDSQVRPRGGPFHFYVLCQECREIPPEQVRLCQLGVTFISVHGNRPSECPLCFRSVESASVDICTSCVSRHLDSGHTWTYHVPRKNRDSPFTKPPQAWTFLNICNNCGHLRFARRNEDDTLKFWYYHVGRSEPTEQPVACSQDRSIGRPPIGEKDCKHDYLLVEDTLKPSSEAIASYKSWDPERLLGFDDYEVRRITMGSKVYWCWRCGARYESVPRLRVHESLEI